MASDSEVRADSRMRIGNKPDRLLVRKDRPGLSGSFLELLLVVVVATAFLSWFNMPLLWSASTDMRLVCTFNSDEEAHVRLIREAIDNGFPRLGYIQYGYAYLNMGLLPLFVASLFREVTDQAIIVWLRIIPTLFAVATIGLAFHLAWRYFGRAAAWLSALLLAYRPLNLLEMSSMSHSDVPQVFFAVLSLYFCCRLTEERRLQWSIWASVAAGLAFGCKYTGVFLLPVVWLVWLVQTVREDREQLGTDAVRVARAARYVALLVGALLVAGGMVLVPVAARDYADAEYFGVSLSDFFGLIRIVAVASGLGLLALSACGVVWSAIARRPRVADVFQQIALSLGSFGIAFAVSSPFNVFGIRSGFLRGFFYESLHSGFGHAFAQEDSWVQWFGVLLSPRMLDALILGLAGISLALTVYRVARTGLDGIVRPASVLWFWVLYYTVFLFWRVAIRTERALLPVAPLVVVLAAHGVGSLLRLVALPRWRRLSSGLAVCSVLVVAGAEACLAFPQAMAFHRETRYREQTSAAVRAGHWLETQYSPSVCVLYDQYTYVPPSFHKAFVTPFGGTLALLETVDPDVVVVSDKIADRFRHAERAVDYQRDEDFYLAKYSYYQALRLGKTDYELVRDFGDVGIYARPSGKGNNVWRIPWLHCS